MVQLSSIRRSAIALMPEVLGRFLRSGEGAKYGMPSYPELSDEVVNALICIFAQGLEKHWGCMS